MIPLDDIAASNARIASAFPAGLVGLFVGATSGIGAGTLKAFAKHASRPRAYFVGRSRTAADAILADCKALNPEGEYIFIQADVSLIRVVDEVCDQIKAKESALNILFLTQGVPSLDRTLTSENLHLLTALVSYSRLRFMSNLLPLIEKATGLRRIVTVGAGGFEGPIDATDISALHTPPEQVRGHIASLMTLGLEAVSRRASGVTLIHAYPGAVDTPLARQLLTAGYEAPIKIPTPEDWLSPEESGERNLFLLTSSRYYARSAGGADLLVSVTSDLGLVTGVDGEPGSGVYSVGVDGESASAEAIEFIARLRKEGLVEKVWAHTQGEFERITGANDV
ncbi:uncharacterized protein BDV17DRAFT_90747 [Aspergillus undulatus]|uniref:uncharacterized protein n=1 Tax=Aspergillus undulatus TaxID=1810928 RepID=UPI003CCCC29E